MRISDFVLEPRGSRLIDVWKHSRGASTPIGDFRFECIVDMDDKPDEEMVAGIASVFDFVLRNPGRVLDALHEHYQGFSRDVEWMDCCGVPLGLAPRDLLPFVRWRSVSASKRSRGSSLTREHYIHISPAWDSEHDIFWGVNRDSLVPLDT
jgi:hypothetical protein